MLRCIQIAQNGLGTTAPNPMVGALVVYNDKIIGEGFTSQYGGSHAEVNALNSVQNKSLLKSATLYVTLEPCSHFGKTPPCADLIIKYNIPKVVIGILDPHEKVAGTGAQKLIDAGAEVVIGVLEKECREHHKRFLTFKEKKRPYIILKWAETSDGFIAPLKSLRETTKQPFWITNTYSRQLVHKWRSEEQAVLIGTTTVLEDNPRLDVRHWKGKNPTRVIIDRRLKIDPSFHVFDKRITTIVCTEIKDEKKYQEGLNYIQIDFSNNVAHQICQKLHQANIQSLFIEGGSQTLQSFINANLWDEARVFVACYTQFNNGTKAPIHSGTLKTRMLLEEDLLNTYFND